MKTKHLIEILRCPGDHRANCAKCEVLESCKELATKLNYITLEDILGDKYIVKGDDLS